MKRLIRALLILIVIGAGAAYFIYQQFIDSPAVPDEIDDPYVYIPSNSSFEDIVAILKEKGFIQNEASFRSLSTYMKYEREKMRTGRYEVEAGWGNIELIRHLRGGAQAPVNVVVNNERLLEDVAGKVAGFLESDSLAFLKQFTDQAYLNEIGYTKETVLTLFIPNTYQLYWNTSPKGFMDRMIREHEKFWQQNNRREKAASWGLSEDEVYTLASIVEKETLVDQEKPRIAGVYLNRLKKGIRLQADPTAVFATRDFDVGRVLNKHINFDSPYNTYMYAGLPPGPIAVPSISSIDGVLNAEKHSYIYFCARGDGTGLHSFAKNLTGHNQNVALYRKNLRARGIR